MILSMILLGLLIKIFTAINNMTIFLDTGFYFALISKKDEYNGRAQEILIELSNDTYGKIFSSNFIFDECMALLNIRTKGIRKDLLTKMASFFIGTQPIAKLVSIKSEWLEEIVQTQIKMTVKQNPLSFTDASNIFVCKKNDITI